MKKVAALLALVLAAAVLVACGDDDGTTAATTSETATGGDTTGGGGGSTVELVAAPDGGLAYTTEEVSTKAGDVTIDFDNQQALIHDVAVEDSNGDDIGKTAVISDDSASVTLKNLKPGTYAFYCTVPGHREGGMEGTLTVR